MLSGGGRANSQATGEPAWGPSAIENKGVKVREGSVADIERVIEDFGRAAKRAETAGFDGVELHGAVLFLANVLC